MSGHLRRLGTHNELRAGRLWVAQPLLGARADDDPRHDCLRFCEQHA